MSRTKIIPSDLIFGVVIWLIVSVICGIAFFPSSATANLTEVLKAVSIAVAIGSAVFSPIAAIVMARYQSQLTNDLEQVKRDYLYQVEALKRTLSASLETEKALMAGKVRAFDTMLTAGNFLYYALRYRVFKGKDGSESLLIEADRRAAEACSVVWYLDPPDRMKWFEVYQQANYIHGLLNNTVADEAALQIFNDNATALGVAIENLEAVGRLAFKEADRCNVALNDSIFRSSEPRSV